MVVQSSVAFAAEFRRFEKVVERHSGERFESFRRGLPSDWEDYKGHVRQEAWRRLNPQAWRKKDIGTGKILDRVIDGIEIKEPRNNLVRWDNRYGPKSVSHRALLDSRRDRSRRTEFESAFFQLFHSRENDGEAFENIRQLAGNRYDLLAYLFFVKDPNRYMPIAPTTFDKAFRRLGVDLITSHKCSWNNYVEYNDALRSIHRRLLEVAGVQDTQLIDAHSFCWMLVRLQILKTQARIPSIQPPVTINSIQNLPPATNTTAAIRNMTSDDWQQSDEAKRRVGELAEDIAVMSEICRLKELGHPHPDVVVRKVAHEMGRGFDILSSELDGTPRYIEVKAARHSASRLTFFLTPTELHQSRLLPNYHFYVVQDAYSDRPSVLALEGSRVVDNFLRPALYECSCKYACQA